MTDRYDMYYSGDDDELDKVAPEAKSLVKLINNEIIIEQGGSKYSVVSKDQYDKVVAELMRTNKKMRIMETKISSLERAIKSLSKSITAGGLNGRFDRY